MSDKLMTFSGNIEVTGPHEIKSDGINYQYIRFYNEDVKNAQMVKKVVATSNIDSYVSPGTAGKFYLAKSGNGMVMYGFKNDTRAVQDIDEVSRVFGKAKRTAWVFIVCSIPLIPIFGLGLIVLFQGVKMLFALNIPSNSELHDEFAR